MYWGYVTAGKFPFWRYLVEFEGYSEDDAKAIAAEYTGEVKTPTFRECLFGLTGQWPEGEGYAAWQKAKLPRLRLGVPDGTELAKEMDELIKGESKA